MRDFASSFEVLTGNTPLSWQVRLYNEWAKGEMKPVIDLPTGLGKTMVMAIWLIARANGLAVPTRLIYVVDRRTVVDQATDLAEKKLAENCKQALGVEPPAISTLRGQRADNHEWSRDPSRPAIIIGTVDLIGSALLFSGYRSSFRRRPLEAGLLGQDSLLILDEAHLSRPFEELIRAIDKFQAGHGKPMRVIRMSATRGNLDGSESAFMLESDSEGNCAGEDAADKAVKDRFGAKKTLTVSPLGAKDKLVDRLAQAAIDLAISPRQEPATGRRIGVFTRKPEDARSIAATIRLHGAKKNTPGPYADVVEVLTGTMRGLERDSLVEKAVFKDRWLNGKLISSDVTNQQPVFLISTSAGEVGFDLNADHMVCDAAPMDSMIQRLGRVNRRGLGDAKVHLIVEPPKREKDDKPTRLEGLELAVSNTIALLHDVNDVSPKHIAHLKGTIWNTVPEEEQGKDKPKSRYNLACAPEPPTVELTDILLDAWSMTSIVERMPGRPEVGPWLRGIDDERAQTTVAWRAELELFSDDSMREAALQAIFIKHSIRPHESLTINTGHLLEFLKKIPKLKDRPPYLMSTRAAIRLSRGQISCRTLEDLVDKPGILYADSTLVLPATFGGLDDSGMLDAESIPKTRKEGDAERSLDVADHEGYEQSDEARSRLRILIERGEDGSWTPKPLPGLSIPEEIKLDANYDKSTTLFNDLKAADLRVRLVQPIRLDDEGDAVQSLVVLAPAPATKNKEDQLLTEHVGAVEIEATRIANALKLAENDPIRIALLFAAKWHDEGKKARIWQVFANNPDPNEPPLGKMAQSRDPKSLRRYRHEFGSILRLHHQGHCNKIGCALPENDATRGLALHLIATHHGAGRPHFGPAVYEPFTDSERDALHTESIRRFARLQRNYGWWHLAWLENLLRCADQLASADEEVTEIDELEGVER